MREIPKRCGGILIAAVFLALALRGVDVRDAARRLGGIDTGCALGILAILGGIYALRTLRWKLLLMPLGRVPAKDVLRAILVGSAANCIVPAYIGDGIRASVLARPTGLRPVAVLGTIALERALDVAAIVGLFLPTIVSLGGSGELWVLAQRSAAIGASALTFLGLVWVLRSLLLSLLPASVRNGAIGLLRSGVQGFGALRARKDFVLQTALVLAQWSLNSLGLYLAAVAIPGMPRIPLSAGCILSAAVVFGGLAPSAPGYLGAMQLAYVVALRPFGVEGEAAIAASLLALLTGYLPLALALPLLPQIRSAGRRIDGAHPVEAMDLTIAAGRSEGAPAAIPRIRARKKNKASSMASSRTMRLRKAFGATVSSDTS